MRLDRIVTCQRLKWCSFAHSTIYLCLLVCWIGGIEGPKLFFGWAHGIGWIIMCILAVLALYARTISMRIGVAVAIIGAVGPFVGSYEFIREERRRNRCADGASRYSQVSDGS
jgi:hypothetical protein